MKDEDKRSEPSSKDIGIRLQLKGLEIEEMAAACDKGPELNIPGSKTEIDMEIYSKELANKTYQQMLQAMDKALELNKEND